MKTINENEDNDLKYLTGDLSEKEKKKKQQQQQEQLFESAEEAPLEYFTE